MIFVILYFLADSTDRAGDGSQIAFAVLMPDCFKDLLLCKQFARMLCHQTQNIVFITTHVHLCSVFENTVVFQVDFQIGTAQSVCGIPHQIEPFKNRLLLRWAVILCDANNNFNFLHKSYTDTAYHNEELKIIELRAKIQKILNYNNYVTGEQNLEYLKQKEPELRVLKDELLDAQKPQDNRKIVLNETTSQELEDIRNSIVESGKSQKVRNMGNLDWKTVTEVSMPVELKYFRSQTKPVMLHLMDYCFCIFSKTILVFTLEGRFVTALQRSCFRVNVQRDRERAYFNLETQSYSSNAVGTDSKCIDKGEERHTWLHTCKDGSMDLRYRNNYRINYRYDTMEYGRIRFSVADFTEEFKFSAEQAILAAEKAAEENEKYKVTRESNNESSVINLLQLLEPSSKSARELEERYIKLDVPQKKYCYIERS